MKSFLTVIIALIITSSVLHAQPLIDPSVKGSEVSGSCILRLKPKTGEVFHYRVSTKSVVSIKNDDDLLTDLMPGLKPIDKASFSSTYFFTKTVRGMRADSAIDFLVHIDSVHSSVDDNGAARSFTSTRSDDCKDAEFKELAIYAGYDFGFMADMHGNIKDVYGYYMVVDRLYANLDDSMQTEENRNTLSTNTYSALEKLFFHTVPYLSPQLVAKDSGSTELYDEDYAVWSSLSFPMQREIIRKVARYEQRGGKTYAVIDANVNLTPKERVLEEDDYHTTLPNFTFANKDIHYVDVATGMMVYDRSTEDISYALKIESKKPEKSGKSFATVSRKKSETVVELMR